MKDQIIDISDEAIENFWKDQEAKEKAILEGMTKEKFEKVLNVAVKEGELVDTDIQYSPQEFNITYEEYSDFCEYLYLKYAPNFPNDPIYDYTEKGKFSDYRIFFVYKDIKFILRLLVGQESCWGVFTNKGFSDKWPSKSKPMGFVEHNKILISF